MAITKIMNWNDSYCGVWLYLNLYFTRLGLRYTEGKFERHILYRYGMHIVFMCVTFSFSAFILFKFFLSSYPNSIAYTLCERFFPLLKQTKPPHETHTAVCTKNFAEFVYLKVENSLHVWLCFSGLCGCLVAYTVLLSLPCSTCMTDHSILMTSIRKLKLLTWNAFSWYNFDA
jgi:hypothetical protein